MARKIFSSKLFIRLFVQIQILFAVFAVLVSVIAIPTLKDYLYKIHEESVVTVINNLDSHIQSGSYMVDDYLKNSIDYKKQNLNELISTYFSIIDLQRDRLAADIPIEDKKNIVIDTVKEISKNTDREVWIISDSGEILYHSRIGNTKKNALEIKDYFNTPVYKNVISEVRRGRVGGVVNYWINENNSDVKQITGYYNFDKKWKWIVCVGGVTNDYDSQISEKETHYIRQLQDTVNKINLFDSGEIYVIGGDFKPIIYSNKGNKEYSLDKLLGEEASTKIIPFLKKLAGKNVLQKKIITKENISKVIWAKYSQEFDWYLVLSVEEKDLFKSVQTIFYRIIIAMLIVLILIDLCVVLFIRSILHPIATLSGTAENVMQGNMDVLCNIERNDEIGFLAKTFNMMILKVRERADSLKFFNSELKQAHTETEKANKSKTRFLTIISHDLLQPINSAKILLSTLSSLVHDKTQMDIIKDIDSNLDSSNQFIKELVTVAKLDAGGITPENKAFNIGELLKEIEIEFRAIALSKNIRIKFRYSDQLVIGDKKLTKHIIHNYISNACRYTNNAVFIGIRNKGTVARVEVKDNGPGISEEKIEKIFEEFVRVDTRPQKEMAYGLGLSIVSKLADLTGVNIGVKSKIDSGSTFYVEIPVDMQNRKNRQDNNRNFNSGYEEGGGADLNNKPAINNSISRESIFAEALKGKNILYIDDDINSLHAVDLLLSRHHVNLTSISSEDELYEVMDDLDDAFDIIIADFHISDEFNGFEAISYIRDKQGVAIPSMIVTADFEIVSNRIKGGENITIFEKPINSNEFIKSLTKIFVTS